MKEYNETINYIETTEPDKVAEYIDNLKQQLAEKDKEILMLKCIIKKDHPEIERITDTNNELTIILDKIVSLDIKQIRKQVCDEIREKASLVNEKHNIDFGEVCSILDQIEKGDK